MTGGSNREKEERAADALLISALRQVNTNEDRIDPKCLPALTDEERAAMNALGSDFVQRLLAGERPLSPRVDPSRVEDEQPESSLAGCGMGNSLDRSKNVNDATSEELQRQEREITERKERERHERELKNRGDTP